MLVSHAECLDNIPKFNDQPLKGKRPNSMTGVADFRTSVLTFWLFTWRAASMHAWTFNVIWSWLPVWRLACCAVCMSGGNCFFLDLWPMSFHYVLTDWRTAWYGWVNPSDRKQFDVVTYAQTLNYPLIHPPNHKACMYPCTHART